MGDLDNNKLQPIILCDVTNDRVAPLDADDMVNHNNNRVHTMNNRDWTDEQMKRIVEIHENERKRGRNFMKRIKNRWEAEYPNNRRTAQNLIGNAKGFKKEGWGTNKNNDQNINQKEVQIQQEISKKMEWTTEMKIKLIMIDEEERVKGRGFMKRVKERWEVEYPEYSEASWQKLRDNAARFKKEKEIRKLMLVRQREEIQVNVEEQAAESDEELPTIAENNENVAENVEEVFLNEIDKDLEQYFLAQLKGMNHSTMINLEPRDKLPKVTLTDELKTSANKILSIYLLNTDSIPEITDKVYAMGRAVSFKLGVGQREQNGDRKQKPKEGNRRERKLKLELKELRQGITRISNELHQRKVRRKASNKEKAILGNLEAKLNDVQLNSQKLRMVKEEWIDKLRYKKVKMQKYIEKRNRIQDNIMYQRDQRSFFKRLEDTEAQEGSMPGMEKFVEFWGGIWERRERTPNMPWMEEVKKQLNEKVNIVQEFEIENKSLRKEIRKRKNWTAPRIDGIQNY